MSDDGDLAAVRAAVRAFLADHAPVRAPLEPGASGGLLWKRLSGELGLAGLAVPEARGGAGASFVEVAAVLEEAGRVLLCAPLLGTLVASCALPPGTTGLAAIAEGSAVALALDGALCADPTGRLTGETAPVAFVRESDLLLVVAREQSGPGLYLLPADASGVTVTRLEPLDPTRPLARLQLDGAPGRRVGGTEAAGHAGDLLAAALAAEAVGAAARCLELTVAHLQTREQFGRPLGSFQALRHRVADLTVALEGARSCTWYAARAAAGASGDLPVAAPLALAAASEAFRWVAGEAIQLHGGIGFTWDSDVHLYFKRAWSTVALHGEPHRLRALAAARAGILEREGACLA